MKIRLQLKLIWTKSRREREKKERKMWKQKQTKKGFKMDVIKFTIVSNNYTCYGGSRRV